jgi:chloride channel 3/4/5
MRCTFASSPYDSIVTPIARTPGGGIDSALGSSSFASSSSSTAAAAAAAAIESVDFSPYVDTTPVTVHPRLPLETVMELFRKIGPRVILIEYHGQLTGLVTVKDCLKYQFKVEAAEKPIDDAHAAAAEGQEQRVWELMTRAATWVSDKVSSASGGRIRLRDSLEHPRRGVSSPRDGGGAGGILDGTEEIGDDEGVELETR